MRAENPLISMADAMYSAKHDNRILPDLKYDARSMIDVRDKKEQVFKLRRPRIEELETIQFIQTWGSTATGFGGMGGSVMTSCYTTIVSCIHTNIVAIFFGGNYCFSVEPNEEFSKDLKAMQIKGYGNNGYKIVSYFGELRK